MDLSHRLDCLRIHGAVDIFGKLQLAVWIIRAQIFFISYYNPLLSIASIDSGGQAHRAS